MEVGDQSAACLLAIKGSLMRCTDFATPDPKLPYTIVTNVSGTAIGGVLMQEQGDMLQPPTFLSRRLKPTEQRHNAYERELP